MLTINPSAIERLARMFRRAQRWLLELSRAGDTCACGAELGDPQLVAQYDAQSCNRCWSALGEGK